MNTDMLAQFNDRLDKLEGKLEQAINNDAPQRYKVIIRDAFIEALDNDGKNSKLNKLITMMSIEIVIIILFGSFAIFSLYNLAQ